MKNAPCGEIIASSLHLWRAQSWRWNYFPPFGSLMAIEQDATTLIGVVTHVETGSLDPTRTPFAYRKTEEELMRDQPHIFEFLQTTFSCFPLATFQSGAVAYRRSPVPPKMHAFVTHADTDLVRTFFSSPEWVHALAAVDREQIDELFLALCTQACVTYNPSEDDLARVMHSFALVLGNDYRRIRLLVQRLEKQMPG